ncbi:PIN domain-like protein [Suillus bovinus]|uniref:PIN domain-like protein n=1 Tax=Suillus bovinus TaxID=48563 RepID=UPI001B86D4C4|nr:PIN domain-like protein [Suillus bovinus]KAG2154183.1 PIN domain-like protein [Suillus bovinus]
MGISGLLPLLKSIQVHRHLSDFAGQTLAVDAYVWLHRGVYACATEIATGKHTTKYVDYAMQRVRLLRHHKICPYIVFDGGPLPAKMGTESERKQRREENLAKAKALASQGRHKEAREYFVKCIDVTPQMAYQLIKALRAENVPYVVAPYEADAQMAYLERIGLVDGIITEDSDLLVFGCRKVLFKLDSVSSTVVSISRDDFGSVTAAEGGISLLGWSDAQFRAMAILSGCDYLPSIPGIGLKTAWSLLRKYRSVEQVVQAIRLEGKKFVPRGYLEAYNLTENVFLHQRVYCPLDERLVNLTDIPPGVEWGDKVESHIGGDIEPALARKLAQGDVDPVTLLPMIDINPSFVPRTVKPLPFQANNVNRPSSVRGKGKAKAEPESGGLFTFFAPKPKATLTRSNSAPTKRTAVPGKGSGKRTLVDILDEDLAAKRIKINQASSPTDISLPTHSRFFPFPLISKQKVEQAEDDLMPSSRIPHPLSDKENLPDYADNVIVVEELDDILEEPRDPVTQEDGYLSPSPSYFRSATPDLSSPVRPYNPARRDYGDGDDFGADLIPSPTAVRTVMRHASHQCLPPKKEKVSILVRETPPPMNGISSGDEIEGPDLHNVTEASARAKRTEIVANGWWNKWALNKDLHTSKTRVLRRRETTITPDGRQPGCRTRLGSALPKAVGDTGIRNSPQFVIGKSPGLDQERQVTIGGSCLEEFRCKAF